MFIIWPNKIAITDERDCEHFESGCGVVLSVPPTFAVIVQVIATLPVIFGLAKAVAVHH